MFFGIAFTFLDIILCLVVLAACFAGSATVESKRFGIASTATLICLAVLGWLFWPQVSAEVAQRGWTATIIEVSVIWLLAGLVTSFIYWVFYIWQVKDNYAEWKERTKNSLPDVKVREFNSSKHEIFDYETTTVPKVTEMTATGAEGEVTVADVLPPRFKHCKEIIIGAGIAWPMTLINLFFARIIDRIIEKFLSMFRGVFDYVSKVAFGGF